MENIWLKILGTYLAYILISALVAYYYFHMKRKELFGGFIGSTVIAFLGAMIFSFLMDDIFAMVINFLFPMRPSST